MLNTQHSPVFFTSTILNWNKLLQPDYRKQIVTDSLKFLVDEKRIRLYGYVIMPNHIHLIMRIKKELLLKDVQRDFQKFTGQQLKFDLQKNSSFELEQYRVNAKDRMFQFWERNPLSIELYSYKVLEQKLDYIHRNPCQDKWRLAETPESYKYSSARFYLEGVDEFGFLTIYRDDDEYF